MAKRDPRLSAAGYSLERVFLFLWRWRAHRPYVGQSGIAWGRRAAMRGARTFIRSQKQSEEIYGDGRLKGSQGQLGELAPYGGVGDEGYKQAPVEPVYERRRLQAP